MEALDGGRSGGACISAWPPLDVAFFDPEDMLPCSVGNFLGGRQPLTLGISPESHNDLVFFLVVSVRLAP